MKTPSPSRSLLMPLLATLAIAAASMTETVSGQMPTPTPVVTFTEYSSTTLTAVYTDGFGTTTDLTVTPGFSGPDSWSVNALAAGPDVLNTSNNLTFWFEPSSTSFFNIVDGQTNVDEFRITSDSAISSPLATANGTRSTS